MSSLSKLKDSSKKLGDQTVPSASTLSIHSVETVTAGTSSSMTYPAAGIAVSNGSAWVTSLTDNSSHWNTAYGWGNHASVGYLTAETDPAFLASAAYGINSTNITNWNTAYGWGDHSGLYQLLDGDLTAIAALSGTSGLLRKTAANTWMLDTSAYTFQYSLTESGSNVNLVNDTASPGNSKLYGTNGSGVRGWYDQPTAGTPTSHANTHEDGGADEISVTGLTGLLATAQTPISHAVNASTYGYGDASLAGHLRVGTGLSATSGTVSVTYGVASGTSCQGNDSRLSDTRTPSAHQLDSAIYHSVSGLTTGHFLKATSATTFGWGAHGLTYTDVGAASSSHNHDSQYISIITAPAAGYFPLMTSGGELATSPYGPSDFATDLHTHGNIANAGTVSSSASVASGDYLLISDATVSNAVTRGIAIGSGTTTYLRNDGAWATPTATQVGAEPSLGSSSTAYLLQSTSTTRTWVSKNSIYTAFQTLTSSSSISWNMNNGYNAKLTLGHNATLSITNIADGMSGCLILTQDATGGRTLTFPATSYIIDGAYAAISSGSGDISILTFVYTGSSFYWSIGNNYIAPV